MTKGRFWEENCVAYIETANGNFQWIDVRSGETSGQKIKPNITSIKI